MRFGVCMDLAGDLRNKSLETHLEMIRSSGFDFAEVNLAPLESVSVEEFSQIRSALRRSGLSCPRANCLFPGSFRLVGPGASPAAVVSYLNNVLPKAEALGVQIIALGSGSARRIPDGYDRQAASREFVSCARAIADTAASHHMRIALEHLNPTETNLLTTVKEAVHSTEQVDHPACGFLFDYYHVDLQTDDINQVAAHGDRLLHVHIALPVSRLFPFPEDAAIMEPFFRILQKAGYCDTVSIEGGMRKDFSYEENLQKSMELLKHASLPFSV